jgi:putative hemolysin
MASSRNPEVLRLGLSSKPLPRPLREAARRHFQWLLGFQRFNAGYSQLPPCEPADFSRMLLEAMRVRVEFSGRPIDTIPATGPLIVIANHPFGMVEGVALDAMLLSRRPDVALMVFHLLASIPEYQDRWIFVDPLRGRNRRNLNVRAWHQSYRLLVRGGALAVFPAGRVARFQWRRLSIADRPWSPDIAALARRTDAPVLPVYFHGRNSWTFQLAGMFCPPLQNLLLIGEATKKRGWTLRATIGRLIQPGELSRFTTNEEVIGFLRRETEMLARS